MKKMVALLAILGVVAVAMVGCGQDIQVSNMTYVGGGDRGGNDSYSYIFKDAGGELHTYWSEYRKPLPLNKGQKYSMEVSVEDDWTIGNYIDEIQSQN